MARPIDSLSDSFRPNPIEVTSTTTEGDHTFLRVEVKAGGVEFDVTVSMLADDRLSAGKVKAAALAKLAKALDEAASYARVTASEIESRL